MPLLRPEDTVVVDDISFQKFMDYRREKNLKSDWGWMHLPAGSLLEVKGLIFRTTGRKKRRKDENGEVVYKAGRSCWVKCSVVTPVSMTGEDHTIPSWLLKKAIVSHTKSDK